jgi:hypothetical protein
MESPQKRVVDGRKPTNRSRARGMIDENSNQPSARKKGISCFTRETHCKSARQPAGRLSGRREQEESNDLRTAAHRNSPTNRPAAVNEGDIRVLLTATQKKQISTASGDRRTGRMTRRSRRRRPVFITACFRRIRVLSIHVYFPLAYCERDGMPDRRKLPFSEQPVKPSE